MATRVRVNGDCDDILKTPFFVRLDLLCGSMPLPNQGACQSRKTAKNLREWEPDGRFSQPRVGGESHSLGVGTFATLGASNRQRISTGVRVCSASLQARGWARRSPARTRARRARSSATARPRWRGAACRRSRRSPWAAGHFANGATSAARARVLSFGSDAFFAFRLRRVLEIGLDLALELDRHRLAVAVAAAAGGDADPAFRDEYSMTLVFSLPLNLMPTPRSSSASSKCSLRGSSERRSGGVSVACRPWRAP